MVVAVEGDMSEANRDESGQYTEKVSEQDILKVFDNADAPFMTAKEVADALPITREAVIYRLKKMRERGIVGSKKTGARAVGWWANVAPALSTEATESADAADRDSAIPLSELEAEFAE